jgi:hemoglobin
MQIEEKPPGSPPFATPFEWMGGPQHYTERFGHPMLRRRHMPFSIGVLERDQWCGVDEVLRARLKESFFQTADWLRNRGDSMG